MCRWRPQLAQAYFVCVGPRPGGRTEDGSATLPLIANNPTHNGLEIDISLKRDLNGRWYSLDPLFIPKRLLERYQVVGG